MSIFLAYVLEIFLFIIFVCRFMLQDVIDLRKSKWIPRRQDSNPKTIDQIKKEAENEHLNIQVLIFTTFCIILVVDWFCF